MPFGFTEPAPHRGERHIRMKGVTGTRWEDTSPDAAFDSPASDTIVIVFRVSADWQDNAPADEYIADRLVGITPEGWSVRRNSGTTDLRVVVGDGVTASALFDYDMSTLYENGESPVIAIKIDDVAGATIDYSVNEWNGSAWNEIASGSPTDAIDWGTGLTLALLAEGGGGSVWNDRVFFVQLWEGDLPGEAGANLLAEFNPEGNPNGFDATGNYTDTESNTWTLVGDDYAYVNPEPVTSIDGVRLYGNPDYVLVDDDNALDLTGDQDWRTVWALDDWTPNVQQALMSKWHGTASDRTAVISIRPSGVVRYEYQSGGYQTSESTVATGFTDGTKHHIRVTVDIDNGAGGHDITFYTSDDGVAWTQLGAVVTVAGTMTPVASTQPLRFGTNNAAGQFAKGVCYGGSMHDGIGGTAVFNWDATSNAQYDRLARGFRESANSLFVQMLADVMPRSFPLATRAELDIKAEDVENLRLAADITGNGHDARLGSSIPSNSAAPDWDAVRRAWDFDGSDDYVRVEDHAKLDFADGEDFTFVVVLERAAATGEPTAYEGILTKDAGGPGYFLEYHSSGERKPNLFIRDGTDTLDFDSTQDDHPFDARVVLAATNGGGTATLYTNGLSNSTSSSTINSLVNSEPLYIGWNGVYLDDWVYRVLIFRYALTAAQIVTLGNDLTGSSGRRRPWSTLLRAPCG